MTILTYQKILKYFILLTNVFSFNQDRSFPYEMRTSRSEIKINYNSDMQAKTNKETFLASGFINQKLFDKDFLTLE